MPNTITSLGLLNRTLGLFLGTGVVAGAIGLLSPAAAMPKPSNPTVTVSKDDGTVESGYGFVPSSTTGTYVQSFDRSDFDGPYLTSVSFCFMKTRGDHDIDFEAVVFGDDHGRPATTPLVVVKASQTSVANSKTTAGALIDVPMPNVELPTGKIYIGARWNPSEELFLFLCNDQSEETPRTEAFFSEDRSPAWTSVFSAKDPIFLPHRAIMVRATSSAKPLVLSPNASGAPIPD